MSMNVACHLVVAGARTPIVVMQTDTVSSYAIVYQAPRAKRPWRAAEDGHGVLDWSVV